MAEQTSKSSVEKVLEAMRKTPGKSAKNIGRAMDMAEGQARAAIKKLETSEDPEIKKLIAKRNAYVMGGAQLVNIIKATPGIGYQKITLYLRDASASEGFRPLDAADLLRGLISYCKEWKDAELREIILKHKNAGGWMP